MGKREKATQSHFNKRKIIVLLNEVLEQEHSCNIRYRTHAAWVKGPHAESVSARLKEIANDEQSHADQLRDRILVLGGIPSMKVCEPDLIEARELKQILHVNIKEEKAAIVKYTLILDEIPRNEILLYETIEHILQDEQEHLEELERLKG